MTGKGLIPYHLRRYFYSLMLNSNLLPTLLMRLTYFEGYAWSELRVSLRLMVGLVEALQIVFVFSTVGGGASLRFFMVR